MGSDIKIHRVSNAGGEEEEKNLILNRFMEELCRRFNAVNRSEMQSDETTFTIKGIWNEVLGNSFPGEPGLEHVRKFVRGHAMEKEPEIEVDVPSDKVELNNKGQTNCTESVG
ncbi:MAG: hypothetical protein ACRD8W_32285 [Nitrososphaeraceae archaeon]